jgi:hypothetical protein
MLASPIWVRGGIVTTTPGGSAGVNLDVGPCDYLPDWDNFVGELSYLLLESGVWTLVLARKLTEKRLLAF